MANPAAVMEIDEMDIVIRLIGTPSEREEGLDLAFKKYGQTLFRYVVSIAPGLPTDCHKEAVLDALRALHRIAGRAEFDTERPLLPLLFTLAKRKTIDQLRRFIPRREFEERLQDEADLAAEVAQRLMGADAGHEWRLAVSLERAKEIQEQFRALVPSLPPVQRQVAQVMADALPGYLKDNEIADAIHALSGTRPTVIQVRSAREQVREKFRATVKSILKR